jgi:hypothetical protein
MLTFRVSLTEQTKKRFLDDVLGLLKRKSETPR